jgi:hypothetical protein
MSKFFFLLFIFQICKGNNENEEIKIKNYTQDEIDQEIKKLNISIDNMDKMMLCSVLMQEALKKDKDRIEALSIKKNVTSLAFFEKIGADIFESCYKTIDMNLVKIYFNNLTYLGGYKWKEEFDKYIEIDYDKYLKDDIEFGLTNEQEMLSKTFNLIKEKMKYKKMEDKEMMDEKNENFFLKIIPPKIKGVIFVLVFGIIFGGTIFLLNKLVNNPKKVKGKKKKVH